MRWQHVDFEQRLIEVVESRTDAGERVVPMFGSARQVLLEHKARSPFKEPQHFVFTTAAGSAVDAQNGSSPSERSWRRWLRTRGHLAATRSFPWPGTISKRVWDQI